MTARQPRRTRRRAVPATALPRPGAGEGSEGVPGVARSMRSMAPRHREHHVTTDYGYVHRDLLAVAVVGAVVIAFIIAMSFLIS